MIKHGNFEMVTCPFCEENTIEVEVWKGEEVLAWRSVCDCFLAYPGPIDEWRGEVDDAIAEAIGVS